MVCIGEPWVSQVVLVVRNPLANAGGIRDMGFIPRSGRSSGGGHCNPLQYSCLENPMDKGVWWATVHRVMSGEHVISLVLSHHNKNLKWQMLKPSACHSTRTDRVSALSDRLSQLLDRPVLHLLDRSVLQLRVTTQFYLENKGTTSSRCEGMPTQKLQRRERPLPFSSCFMFLFLFFSLPLGLPSVN